jgi:predicted DsbA family dithiol-disulfide isomerase
LERFASEISGLEIQKFGSCFDSQKYKSFIENDIALAHSLGFTQSPSFIIVKSDGSNPQKIEEAQPLSVSKALIGKEIGSS